MPDRVTSTPGTTQPGMIPGEAAGLPGGSQKKMLATVRSKKIAVGTASGHETASLTGSVETLTTLESGRVKRIGLLLCLERTVTCESYS